MKYLTYLIALLSVSCQPSYAEQSVDWYGKIAYNYIVEQPTIKGTYEFQNNSYSVEYGIEIDPDGASSYRFGLYWFDQIGMDKVSKGRYEPKYLEVFGERAYNVGDWYGRIGWGYKAYQDAYINNLGSPSSQVIKSPLDRVTARFAIGKKIGQWEVELGHHSNWFVNKPFDSRWEYHQTSISIGYVFN